MQESKRGLELQARDGEFGSRGGRVKEGTLFRPYIVRDGRMDEKEEVRGWTDETRFGGNHPRD